MASADGNPRPRKTWTDLVFKVLAALGLGYLLSHFVLPGYVYRRQYKLADREKWLVRPKLDPKKTDVAGTKERSSEPCFFLLPPGATSQPVDSGSVSDCLGLVPNGRRLDLFELNLRLGYVYHIKTDLYVPDVMPLAFTRTYFPLDDWNRKFRIYLPHVYDPFLTGRSRFPYTDSDWLLPDRLKIHFGRISSGTGYADYVGESRTPQAEFIGSRIAWNGWGWDLSLPDGTTYLSPEAYNAERPQQGSLTGIFDKEGHEVKLTRASNGDLQEITSPGGHWVKLAYNTLGQVVSATDDSSNHVDYYYDSEGRVQKVLSASDTTAYSYDSSSRLVRVSASDGLDLLYESDEGRISMKLTMNGECYTLRVVADQVDRAKGTGIAHLNILEPSGQTLRVKLAVSADGGFFWSPE